MHSTGSWLSTWNVLLAPRHACGLLAARAECSPALQDASGMLAARAECSPRAAIRVRIVGCARGMLSPRRNTRASRWLRARNIVHAPQYARGLLAASAECSPRAAIRVRNVGRAHRMFFLCRNTQADRCMHMRVIGRPVPRPPSPILIKMQSSDQKKAIFQMAF